MDFHFYYMDAKGIGTFKKPVKKAENTEAVDENAEPKKKSEKAKKSRSK